MPEVPKWFEQKMSSRFGTTLDGRPKRKVVFGATERDIHGNFKYINPMTNKPWECWVLVSYAEPEFFGDPNKWESRFYDDVHQKWIDRPFPYRGDYIFICPVSDDGSLLPLTEDVFQSICRKVRADEQFHEMNGEQRSDYVHFLDHQRQVREQQASDDKAAARDEYYKTNWDRINAGTTRGYSTTPR